MTFATSLRYGIQRAMRSIGYEIRRFTLGDISLLKHLLDYHKVDTVLDIGANIGQFASSLRLAGFGGRIISFEPQSDAHSRLTMLARDDPQWIVAPRCAVGSAAGEISMNISGNSVSSSVLPIEVEHTDNAPSSAYISTESVKVITLDECDLVPKSGRFFVKIDTQGFEGEVIRGGHYTLTRAIGIQTELSIAPLYTGQPDFTSLLRELTAMGFEIWSIQPGFEAPRSRKLLQMDATLFRSDVARDS